LSHEHHSFCLNDLNLELTLVEITSIRQCDILAFIVETKDGGRSFTDMDALKTAFQARELNPDDLKLAVATFLNRLLDPIREKFDNEPMRRLVAEAYPHFGN
jgi:hypothetical protein